jgi:SAM-dependent methyltransferase
MSSTLAKQIAIATVGKDTAIEIRRYAQEGSRLVAPLRYRINRIVAAPLHWAFVNPINRARYRKHSVRRLEIGPGADVLKGFETVDVTTRRNVTYLGNALRLPLPSDTFSVVYASHIIEHVPWYHVETAIREWVRVLRPGGVLQIWTPNGLRIAKAFVDAEERGSRDFHNDGWWRFNEEKDACKWASGRCFSYGDGSGRSHPNWHMSLFSPRYLRQLLVDAGLTEVREMDRSEVRGHDHGWINLGVCGTKPRSTHRDAIRH